MSQFAEILAAQAEQRRTIELRVSTHVVIRVGMEFFAIFVLPLFLGLIFAYHVYRVAVPILFLAIHVVTALDEKNSFAGWSKPVSKRSAACSAADDDHVVLSR